jgi:hypothetical protein
MPASETITRRIEIMTNLSDQVATVMNLAGDPRVMFSIGDGPCNSEGSFHKIVFVKPQFMHYNPKYPETLETRPADCLGAAGGSYSRVQPQKSDDICQQPDTASKDRCGTIESNCLALDIIPSLSSCVTRLNSFTTGLNLCIFSPETP